MSKESAELKKNLIGLAVVSALCFAGYTYYSSKKEEEPTKLEKGKDLLSKGYNKYKDYADKKKEEQLARKTAKNREDYEGGTGTLDEGFVEDTNKYGEHTIKTGDEAAKSDKYINVNDLAIRSNSPAKDKLFLAAVKTGSLERVDFLLQDGISVDFDYKKLCIVKPSSSFSYKYDFSSLDFPTKDNDFPYYITHMSFKDKVFLPTSCEKLFLFNTAEKIDKKKSKEHFAFYKNPFDGGNLTASDLEAIKMEEEKISIYKKILEKTDKRDYLQLINIVGNKSLPFSIRDEALDKLLENYQDLTGVYYGEARTSFAMLNSYIERRLTEGNDKQLIEVYNRVNNPILSLVPIMLGNYSEAAGALITKNQNLLKDQRVAEQQGRDRLKNKVIDNISVDNLVKGDFKFEVSADRLAYAEKHNPNDPYVYPSFFREELEYQQEAALFHKFLTSKFINLNSQDVNGETILHHVVKNSGDYGVRASGSDQAPAIVVRALINLGADPNLLNKESLSALEMLTEIGNIEFYPELSDAFFNKEYTGEIKPKL